MCLCACLCFQLLLLQSLKAVQVNLTITISFFFFHTHYLYCNIIWIAKIARKYLNKIWFWKNVLSCIHFINTSKYSYHICLSNSQRSYQGITMMGHFKECKCGENVDLFERLVHCTAQGHIPETVRQKFHRWETVSHRQTPSKSWA